MSYFNCLRVRVVSLFLFISLSGFLLAGLGQAAPMRERERHEHEFLDSRYHHDHYYPERGHFIRVLPRDSHEIIYGDSRYYSAGGVWYRRDTIATSRGESARRKAALMPYPASLNHKGMKLYCLTKNQMLFTTSAPCCIASRKPPTFTQSPIE